MEQSGSSALAPGTAELAGGGNGEAARAADLPLPKKPRIDSGGGGGMRRVAEIVMVLSALGRMRGGRSPGLLELALMAEAREKLAAACESLVPRDLVPIDAIGALVKDLGLFKAKEARMGFRAPKTSIAEKFSILKSKMEVSKELTAKFSIHSPQEPQVATCSNSDNLRTLPGERPNAVHGQLSEKPGPVPQTASEGFPSASPLVLVSAVSAASSGNQSQVPVLKPAFVLMPSFGSPPLESASSSIPLPQMEAAHFRLDGQSAYVFQVQASPGNLLPESSPSTCSSQSSFVVGDKGGDAHKLADHSTQMPVRPHEQNGLQSAPQTVRDLDSKAIPDQRMPLNTRTVQHPSSQAANFVQAPCSNHVDIARNVQKTLQPTLDNRPSWTTPPNWASAADFMTAPLICQMCKVSITDVDSLLVCDACEKAFHIKCLQPHHIKGIPKGDWHCPKCLIASKGKPLPPKYGRVTRNVRAAKVSSNSSGSQVSSEKKRPNPIQELHDAKTTANGSSDSKVISTKPTPAVSTGPSCNPHVEPFLNWQIANPSEAVESSVSGTKMEDKPSQRTCSESSGVKALQTCVSEENNEKASLHIPKSESPAFQMQTLPSAPKLQLEAESRHSSCDPPIDAAISPSHQSQQSCDAQGYEKTQSQAGAEPASNQSAHH